MKTFFTRTWTKILASLLVVAWGGVSDLFDYAVPLAVQNGDILLIIVLIISLFAYCGFIGALGAYIWLEGFWKKRVDLKDETLGLYDHRHVLDTFMCNTYLKYINRQIKDITLMKEKELLYCRTIQQYKEHKYKLLGMIKNLNVDLEKARIKPINEKELHRKLKKLLPLKVTKAKSKKNG